MRRENRPAVLIAAWSLFLILLVAEAFAVLGGIWIYALNNKPVEVYCEDTKDINLDCTVKHKI